MADANFQGRARPTGWGDAFAALPLEPAPADGWSRLASGLPVQATPPARGRMHPRGGHPWVALAASVVLAMPVAWWLSTDRDATPPSHSLAHDAAEDAMHPAPERPAPAVASTSRPGVSASIPPASSGAGGPALPGGRATSPTNTSGAIASTHAATADRTVQRAATRPSRRQRPAAADDVRVAAVESSPGPMPAGEDAEGLVADAALDSLRQASARLEAVVAHARNDRMSSAPAAVMRAALDDRIRLVDAALSEPGVTDALSASLWHQRVATLQELAALEGTQRWMAAHGSSMDAVARVD